jgi:hypothetical protein
MRSCLSPLQAGRKHFDEKLWNGKNETKFDNQHNWQGFLAFVQHPIVHPFLTDYDLGSSESDARHALILDRHERKLSIASITDADTFLAQQWPKLPAVHLTREEWEALQTKVITTMKRKEQLIDMEEIHRRIEAQYAVVEALQHWLNQFLAN